jgi:hypothetical protein
MREAGVQRFPSLYAFEVNPNGEILKVTEILALH